MTNDRQHQITELYHAALGRDGRQRAEFLREACAGDGALRREVESLLGYEDAAAPFLERPAVEEAARMIDHAREGSESAMREDGTGDLAGRRIGVYQIETRIGAGGMGEVYRARDTKLGRDVAIKVLPPHLVADPERRTRFEREARMLATLNHPHIAHIYGFEESSGISALVMELVPGETLDEIIAGGRHSADNTSRRVLPLDQTLQIARQIADALEAAHERGIVHRDLKPANVKVTSDGTVKVLDFGLAKAMIGDASGPDLSQLPTITSDGTRDGIILGTPAYMSPEQARGKSVDKRTDIWAFGGVLYEMLTGRPAFQGETVSDTIAAILEREPDWNALPSSTPARLRGLIGDCLTRDPRQRLRDIGDARIAINRLIGGAPDDVAIPTALPIDAVPRWQRALPWTAAVIATAVAGAVLALWAPWGIPLPPDAFRFSVDLGADVSLSPTRLGSTVALSPDGKRLAFTADKTPGGRTQLYVRNLTELQATPLSGTDGARDPIFSPDGESIAFYADGSGSLKKISVAGGSAAFPIVKAENPRGAWWSEDDTIIFERSSINGLSLMRVKAGGGETEPVGALADGEATQRWPQVLPGGKAVLFTGSSSEGIDFNNANLVVQALRGGPPKIVVFGGYYGRYVPSGHLIYMHDTTLFAMPFDLARLEPTGSAVPVLDGIVASPADGSAQFAISASGTLAYVPGRIEINKPPMAWMDRSEKTTPLDATTADWYSPRFSPKGENLALQIWDGKQSDVWIYDLKHQIPSQLTFGPANDGWPVWTPGGQGIVFSSSRKGPDGNQHGYLYWRRADGTGEEQQLTADLEGVPASWHPKGKFLAVTREQGIFILPMEGNEINGWKAGKAEVFQETTARGRSAMFSPEDGRWIAYTASDNEVYVRPFRGPGGPWTISSGGGSWPTWSAERPELFYGTSTGTIMVVTYSVEGNSFIPGKPRPWSPAKYLPSGFRRFDLHPDGIRFVVEPVGEQPQERHDKVVFIFNFFDELRRIAPPTKR